MIQVVKQQTDVIRILRVLTKSLDVKQSFTVKYNKMKRSCF